MTQVCISILKQEPTHVLLLLENSSIAFFSQSSTSQYPNRINHQSKTNMLLSSPRLFVSAVHFLCFEVPYDPSDQFNMFIISKTTRKPNFIFFEIYLLFFRRGQSCQKNCTFSAVKKLATLIPPKK